MMKKINTDNQELLEALAENGIITTCTSNMDVVISDDDADRIDGIVKEFAPAASQDYCIEDVEIHRVEYKKQILAENYRQSDNEQNFLEWVQAESENDPGFFRWLFEIDILADFECPNKEAFEKFLEWIVK